MTTHDQSPDDTPPTPQAQQAATQNRLRFFYAGAAAFLLILVLLGFQQFYLQGKAYPGRELTPPIRTLVILHGIGMSAWMLLFLIQPLLIVAGNRRMHMRLGKFGAGLATLVLFLGMRLAIESARVNPPDLLLWGLSPKQFMAISFISILIFGVLVALGIWKRKRPEIHRPMMLLSILAIMPAVMDRIDPIKNLYADTIFGTLFGPFFSTLLIGLLLLAVNWALTRSIDHYLAIGYTALVLASIAIMQLAPTATWDHIATFLLG